MRTKLNGEKCEFDWGSCQYDTAAETYHELLSKRMPEDAFVNSKKIENPDLDALRKELIEIATAVLEAFEIEDMTRTINAAIAPEEFLSIAKDLAFDLWSCEFIISYFVEYTILDKKELETFGPIFNRLSQSENFETGVACYLLTKYYETPEDAFTNFDT